MVQQQIHLSVLIMSVLRFSKSAVKSWDIAHLSIANYAGSTKTDKGETSYWILEYHKNILITEQSF